MNHIFPVLPAQGPGQVDVELDKRLRRSYNVDSNGFLVRRKVRKRKMWTQPVLIHYMWCHLRMWKELDFHPRKRNNPGVGKGWATTTLEHYGPRDLSSPWLQQPELAVSESELSEIQNLILSKQQINEGRTILDQMDKFIEMFLTDENRIDPITGVLPVKAEMYHLAPELIDACCGQNVGVFWDWHVIRRHTQPMETGTGTRDTETITRPAETTRRPREQEQEQQHNHRDFFIHRRKRIALTASGKLSDELLKSTLCRYTDEEEQEYKVKRIVGHWRKIGLLVSVEQLTILERLDNDEQCLKVFRNMLRTATETLGDDKECRLMYLHRAVCHILDSGSFKVGDEPGPRWMANADIMEIVASEDDSLWTALENVAREAIQTSP